MIKANELRIGNIIRDGLTNEPLRVISLDENNILTSVINRSKFPLPDGWYIDPIPLTPEILDVIDWNGYNKFCINSYFKIDYMCHLYYCNDYTGINIKHLHQLQNLYFALTGEELSVNL